MEYREFLVKERSFLRKEAFRRISPSENEVFVRFVARFATEQSVVLRNRV